MVTEKIRTRIVLEGPFYEGDEFIIPFDISGYSLATEEPDGWRHYVVLRRVGLFGYRYRLEGIRDGDSSAGEARSLEITLAQKVERVARRS